FDDARLARRHYLVEDPATLNAAAYGAVEQTPGGARYRLYMVVHPAFGSSGIDDALFERLMADLRELGASAVWAMEYHDDTYLLPFLRARGFADTRLTWDLRLAIGQVDLTPFESIR